LGDSGRVDNTLLNTFSIAFLVGSLLEVLEELVALAPRDISFETLSNKVVVEEDVSKIGDDVSKEVSSNTSIRSGLKSSILVSKSVCVLLLSSNFRSSSFEQESTDDKSLGIEALNIEKIELLDLVNNGFPFGLRSGL